MNILNFKNIKGDIYGGITAGVIALPLALAFGVASGLGAAAGLYGAIIVCLFATIFGGTATQISGPTGPMTVVVASIVLSHPNDLNIVFMAILLAGIFQIIFGLLKIGEFIKFVPYSVISGFMSGVGAIIILLQLNPLVGISFEGTPIKSLFHFLFYLKNADYNNLLLGVLTLIIVFFTPKKISSKIPAPLIALIFVSLISVVMGLDVKTIGEIPSVFPSISFPTVNFGSMETVVPLALTLALLGSIDSLLTSLVADSLTKTKFNSSKELIGQGLGNLFSSFFGALAGAGATMRTVVNIKSGGSTRLSGIVHSLFLICVILFFSPLASKIPLAVLAGILIKVGFDIIDYKFLKVLKSAPRSDLAVMLLVFAITVLHDLILAVGIGIVLSSILFALNVARQTNVDIRTLGEDENYEDDHCIEEKNHIMIMRIRGTFFFGSASRVLSRIEGVLDTRHVIIDCGSLKTFDISAFFALEDMIIRIKESGAKVSLVLSNRKLAGQLLRLGLIKILSRNDVFFQLDKAIEKSYAAVGLQPEH